MRGIILGASGFLGKKIYSNLKEKYELIGTFNSKRDENFYKLDVTDKKSLIAFLKNKKFDFIIDCIAIADPEKCLENKEKTRLINTSHIEWLCSFLKNKKAKLIYISTDFVFDGSSPPYDEESLPSPINFYGETKLNSEKIVLKQSKNIVLRLQVLYGFNCHKDKTNFFNKIYKLLKQKKTIYLDDIRKRYPTFIDDIPIAIEKLLEKNAKGIYHLCNEDAITHYVFGLKVAKEFGYPTNLIKRCGIENNKTCRRPKDNCFTCKKIKRLGVKISTIGEGLKEIHKKI